jgi:hypothetical protein
MKLSLRDLLMRISRPNWLQCLVILLGKYRHQVPISLNGKQFHVTKNLHAALVCLRARRAYPSSVFWALLWIDAICVNQTISVRGMTKFSLCDSMLTMLSIRCRQDILKLIRPRRMNYDGSLEAARTLGSWVIHWSDLMPDMIGKLDPQDELPRHAFTAVNIIPHLSTRKATLNELPVVGVRADSIAHISCILKELPTGILDIFTWLDFIMSK